tara:strand:- start:317 stop:1198 length:882 start_codon:yes stop_codon:yes gene_type:complete
MTTKLNTKNFYQELLIGEKGRLDGLGATMKVSFELFKAKDSINLKTNGFIDNAELNEDTLIWIKDTGLNFLNAGYQLQEKKKDNPFKDYETVKKERPELLRVLRDALPVACFLIDSDSPLALDGEYFTKPETSRALQMYINSKKLTKKDMQTKFNSAGAMAINCAFSDLQQMTSFWFFEKERPTAKTSFESANEKISKALTNGINKDGMIKADNPEQLESTLKSNLKIVQEYLSLFDIHNRGDLITNVVKHIEQLNWFNNKCLPEQNIKFFGVIHEDAIKINQIENIKKTAIK